MIRVRSGIILGSSAWNHPLLEPHPYGDKTLRITFLIYKYFPFGGQQRDFMKIATECFRRGHEVEVYALSWEGEAPPQFKIHIVPVEAFTSIRRYQKFTRWIGTRIKDRDPGVIVGFCRMPSLDIHFAADPCFLKKSKLLRGPLYKYSSRFRHFSKYENSVFGLESSTRILLISDQQEEDFSFYYPGCETRCIRLPPGIERDRMANSRNRAEREKIREDIRDSLGLTETSLLLLQIGSGFKVKGIDRSLRAVASLTKDSRARCKYVLIGDDDPAPYEALATKLGIENNFIALGGRDNVPDYLAAADLLLHPAYMESAGYTLLEAVVAGLPVLTTASCGFAPYVLEAEAGKVCTEPFQQPELDQKLAEMLSGLKDSSWGANGINYGENTDLFSFAASAASAIEEVGTAKLSGPGR